MGCSLIRKPPRTRCRLPWGQFFADFINLGGIIGGFASCLAVQVSASRLLYFMGREDVLPRRYFARLQGKGQAPVFNLLLIAGLGVIGIAADVSSGASLINFGAFLAFAAVNACVIGYYLRERRKQRLSARGFVVLPLLAIGVNLYLLSLLSTAVISVGVAWLGCGGLYLMYLTAGFRKPVPGLIEVEP